MHKSSRLWMAVLAGGIVGSACVWIGMRWVKDPGDVGAPAARLALGHAAPEVAASPGHTTPAQPGAGAAPGPLRFAESVENSAARTDPGAAANGAGSPPPADVGAPIAFQAVATQSFGTPPVPARMPTPSSHGDPAVVDALSFALEAAERNAKEGFTIREDFWGGRLPAKSPHPIVHQLFKGNEYWFWMGAAAVTAQPTVHIYDAHGARAEAEHWQRGQMAAARISPRHSGSYYIIVEIEKCPEERSAWALAYGFR